MSPSTKIDYSPLSVQNGNDVNVGLAKDYRPK